MFKLEIIKVKSVFVKFGLMCSNSTIVFRPIFKKPILGMRIESKLEMHQKKTNVRLAQWHPCNSELGFNPQAQDWIFEYGF